MLTDNKPGQKELLMGNHAVVRGAIEAGVQVAATYPGTPASEIGDTLSKVAKRSVIILNMPPMKNWLLKQHWLVLGRTYDPLFP